MINQILFLLCIFIQLSFSALFNAPGWEYEKRALVTPGQGFTGENLITVKVEGKKKYIFHKKNNTIYATLSHHPGEQRTIILCKSDPNSKPVIKEIKEKTYLLVFHNASVRLYLFDQNKEILRQLTKIDTSINYGYDLFKGNSSIIITLPIMIGMKKSIQLYRYNPEINKIQDSHVLSNLDQNWKGLFWPQIYTFRDKIHLSCIIREYDSQKKNLIDSIYFQVQSSVSQLNVPAFIKVNTTGTVHYPPKFLSFKNKLYLLYASQKQSGFQIRLFNLNSETEYTMSERYVNSPDFHFFQKHQMVTMFYINKQKSRQSLFFKKINLQSLKKGKHSVKQQSRRVTDTAVYVDFFQICCDQTKPYVFFTVRNSSDLFFSQEDKSVQMPFISQILKTDNTKSYPLLYISNVSDPSGIKNYHYRIDHFPNSPADQFVLPGEKNLISTKNLLPGAYYIHLQVKDGLNNRSPVRHFRFTVTAHPMTSGLSNTTKIVKQLPADIANEQDRLKAYYQNIETAKQLIKSKDYFSAKKYLRLAILIEPGRIDHHILLLKNLENRVDYLHKGRMVFNIIFVISVILAMLFLLYRLQKQ